MKFLKDIRALYLIGAMSLTCLVVSVIALSWGFVRVVQAIVDKGQASGAYIAFIAVMSTVIAVYVRIHREYREKRSFITIGDNYTVVEPVNRRDEYLVFDNMWQ